MAATIVILLFFCLVIFANVWGYYADKRELERLSRELKRCSDVIVTQVFDHGGGDMVYGDTTYCFRSNSSLVKAIKCATMRDCNITNHTTILGGI